MADFVVTAEKLVFGGDILAEPQDGSGKVLFLPGLIPGEVAQVEIISSHKDYDRGKMLSILEPSPHRIEPACPYYTQCGGCNMLHISPDFQVQLRKQVLQDIFQREGLTIPPVEAIRGRDFGYRCRMQLTDGGLQQRGMNKNPIPITQCPCGTEEINNWLQQVPPQQRAKGRIQLFGDQRIQSQHKVLFADSGASGSSSGPKIAGKTNRKIKDKVKHRFSGTTLSPATTCSLQLSPAVGQPKLITFDVRGFFQSNLEVLEKAISLVIEYVQEIKAKGTKLAHALDIYSGAGTISVFLADYFDTITLVEHNRDAIAFAEQNLLGKNHQSYGISGEKWAKEFGAGIVEKNPPQLAFVDPPRSGMEKAVRYFLTSSKIPHIAYLSCDPATQARDCKALIQAGYTIRKLFLLDFYPNTGHMETLAFLEQTHFPMGDSK